MNDTENEVTFDNGFDYIMDWLQNTLQQLNTLEHSEIIDTHKFNVDINIKLLNTLKSSVLRSYEISTMKSKPDNLETLVEPIKEAFAAIGFNPSKNNL